MRKHRTEYITKNILMLKADRFFLHETCTAILVQLSSYRYKLLFSFTFSFYNYVINHILIYVKLRSQLVSIVKLSVTKYINFFEIFIFNPFYMSEINLHFMNNYINIIFFISSVAYERIILRE